MVQLKPSILHRQFAKLNIRQFSKIYASSAEAVKDISDNSTM
jgi:hypothetical protein